MPHLRRPIGVNDRRNERSKDHVRFADEPDTKYRRSGRHTIGLTALEKEARKEDALKFLRRRNGYRSDFKDHDGIHSRLRASSYPIRHTDYGDRDANKRTYELMKESPIRRIKSPQGLDNDNVLRSVRREASTSMPLLDNRRFTTSSRESSREVHKGLLDSLSSVGSRLLGAALFNEKKEDGKLRENERNGNTDSFIDKWNRDELERINTNNELERQIRQKRKVLEQLDSSIKRSTWHNREPVVGPGFTESDLKIKMDKLEKAIKTLHGSTSKEDVIKELGIIRQDLLSMKSRQESNNMKFESRMEELQLEAQLNLRRYKKMMEDLEQKRKEIEKQKDDMIRMLKKVVRKKRKREEMSDSDGEEEIDDFPISRKDEEDIDDDDGNADLRSDMDSISEFETEKSPKQVSKLSPVQRGGRKRRKTTSRSIRSKLNKITQRMKVMEHDVSRNRHQAKKLQEEA